MSDGMAKRPATTVQIPDIALEGALFFGRRPLDRVMHSLRHTFGIGVRVGSGRLYARHFCNSFQGSRAVAGVLSVVTTGGGLRCAVGKSRVVVSEGGWLRFWR